MWSRDKAWCDGVWVHDSYLARNGRQGITVAAARNVLIEHNVITNTHRATVDLEPGALTYGAENVHIIDNDIGPGVLRFVAAHGKGPVNGVVIARNTLTGTWSRGRRRSAGGDAAFGLLRGRQHERHAGANTPLHFTRLDGVLVRDNTQPMIAKRPVILATEVCGLEVAGNTFTGAAQVVSSTGAACAQPTAGPVPLPPDLAAQIPARTIGAERPRQQPSAATTTSTSPPHAEAAGRHSSSSGLGAWGVILAGVGLGGLVLLGIDRSRRSRRPRSRGRS